MKEHILQLDCKKHVKIFKLHQLGLKNSEIATELKTNVGHVYNVLKDYKENESKVAAANGVLIDAH